uniref:Secreted protein n=1 Tax=Plectus sambesii TaxID=2011161 RepID=A0A914X0J9_9BILA
MQLTALRSLLRIRRVLSFTYVFARRAKSAVVCHPPAISGCCATTPPRSSVGGPPLTNDNIGLRRFLVRSREAPFETIHCDTGGRTFAPTSLRSKTPAGFVRAKTRGTDLLSKAVVVHHQ